ncbi:MAG: exodeoxyribonuclease III [Alphaproteobacteria bacterium]|nr:exodeoxyribonuclease III [Alphaproteobacteria bacterium]
MPLTIATWNVNSLRIREAMLARFIGSHAPDVLCLQETKVTDADFPHDLVARLGYAHCLFAGEKSYNGVAILSKLPLTEIGRFDLIGNGQKRHIGARLENGVEIHNFYVPAGGDLPDPALNPKFDEKLRFVAAMRDWSAQEVTKNQRVVILGDFNIAPLEHDVWSSRQLRDVVSHTAVEREALGALQRESGGWVDALRHLTPPEQKLYSWWSYRNRDWDKSDRGRRLDHIWLTPALMPALTTGQIVRDARGFESPSDHVPVIVELEPERAA